MKLLRTFLAVPLPAPLLAEVLAIRDRLAMQVANVSWSKPENMHLTLKFLGAIPEESLEKIAAFMLSIEHLHAPFELEIFRAGAFPTPKRPRVFWLGFKPNPLLTALHAQIENGLAELGFPREERSFAPHLTLGRSRRPQPPAEEVLASACDISCHSWPVERIILYESRLQPEGALHLPRQTFFLRGPRTGGHGGTTR